MKSLFALVLISMIANSYQQTQVIWECEFETDLCNMQSSTYTRRGAPGAQGWIRGEGYTVTGTPRGEHGSTTGPSSARAGTGYLQFEASGRLTSNDLSSTVRTPDINGRYRDSFSIELYTSQLGEHLSTLLLRIRDSTTNQILTTQTLKNSTAAGFVENANWLVYQTSGFDNLLQRMFYIEIEGSVKFVPASSTNSYNGDWAIDSFKVMASPERQCIVNSDCTDANAVCSNNSCQCRPTYVSSGGAGRNITCALQLTCANVVCSANTTCAMVGNAPVCSCNQGYRSSGSQILGAGYKQHTCNEINECTEDTHGCHATATCSNTPLGSFSCVCAQGYEVVPGTGGLTTQCRNIDECTRGTFNCTGKKVCRDNDGGYECVCPDDHTYRDAEDRCYTNGGLTEWQNVGGCTKECGGGKQLQRKFCTNPPPEQPHGQPCTTDTNLIEQQIDCNTGDCAQGCNLNKTCDCSTVPGFSTGNEPKTDLVFFSSLTTQDVDDIAAFLHIWTDAYLDEQCSAAKCDMMKLDALYANVTYYVDLADKKNDDYEMTKDMVRKYINCNSNVEIESNLWDVYDVILDQCIAIYQMLNDLKMKQKAIHSEKNRCMERGWYRRWMETMTQAW